MTKEEKKLIEQLVQANLRAKQPDLAEFSKLITLEVLIG